MIENLQEPIEILIISFIKEKFKERDQFIYDLTEKNRNEIASLEKQKKQLKICKYCKCQYSYYNNMNDIERRIFYLDQDFNDQLKWLEPLDYVKINLDEFQLKTRLNRESVKKYLNILEEKGVIHRKRGVTGFIFKIINEL